MHCIIPNLLETGTETASSLLLIGGKMCQICTASPDWLLESQIKRTSSLRSFCLLAIGGEEVVVRLLMVLAGLSTEEVLQKISEAGIEVTDVEAQRFRGKFLFKC